VDLGVVERGPSSEHFGKRLGVGYRSGFDVH
jgi:hypothetical protein